MRVYFIKDQPKLKCREQKCENCDLTKILKNPSALVLPFPINNNAITRTYFTSKKAHEVERINEKVSTFTKLPVGTLIIINDFSQNPKFQIAQDLKTSNQVFEGQKFLLGPTPCFLVTFRMRRSSWLPGFCQPTGHPGGSNRDFHVFVQQYHKNAITSRSFSLEPGRLPAHGGPHGEV